jgi:hypothetical protein
MPDVTIRCPDTGKFMKPPIRVATLEHFEKMVFSGNRILCEHCGDWHVFDKETAEVVPDTPIG